MTTEGLLCIIPARATSKRFPGKNTAPIAGRPLVGQAIRVARASGIFATICVSSDSEDVLAVAHEHGADLGLLRTGRTAAYEAQVKDVCRDVIEEAERRGLRHDTFAVLLPTSPLRTADDLRQAYRQLQQSDADGCMSVVPFEHPPQRALTVTDGQVRSFFGDRYMQPAERLDPLYRHDGAVLFVRRAPFLDHGGFYGLRLVPYLMPRDRAVDIDDPLDLAWAEFLVTSGRVALDA